MLCEGMKNGGMIPLNKNLWSLSFVLVMGGSAFFLLAGLYFVIDVILWWNGAPFKYPGACVCVCVCNTLGLIILSLVERLSLSQRVPYRRFHCKLTLSLSLSLLLCRDELYTGVRRK